MLPVGFFKDNKNLLFIPVTVYTYINGENTKNQATTSYGL